MSSTGTPAVPDVPVFDASVVTPDQVIQGLIVAGGVIIRNAVPIEQVNLVAQDVEPQFDSDKAWNEDGFFPPQVRMAYGLAQSSKAFVDYIIKNELYQKVCDLMLSTKSTNWNGVKKEVSVSRPQLSTTTAFRTGPGSRNQALHRDDMIHHNSPLPAILSEDYNSRRDTGINFFVAGRRTTQANGATRFIPGSHLWASETTPDESLCVHAELGPGDGFMMLHSVLHGGSANTTENEYRLLFCAIMIRGYLRQEENQFLANDPAVLKNMHDRQTMELLGYGLSLPYLGWVAQEHPLKSIYGNEWKDEKSDLF